MNVASQFQPGNRNPPAADQGNSFRALVYACGLGLRVVEFECVCVWFRVSGFWCLCMVYFVRFLFKPHNLNLNPNYLDAGLEFLLVSSCSEGGDS